MQKGRVDPAPCASDLPGNDVQIVARQQISGGAARLLTPALLVVGALGETVVVAARVIFPRTLPWSPSANRPGYVHVITERSAARLVTLCADRERSAGDQDEHGQS